MDAQASNREAFDRQHGCGQPICYGKRCGNVLHLHQAGWDEMAPTTTLFKMGEKNANCVAYPLINLAASSEAETDEVFFVLSRAW
jgi:hypothetical protein